MCPEVPACRLFLVQVRDLGMVSVLSHFLHYYTCVLPPCIDVLCSRSIFLNICLSLHLPFLVPSPFLYKSDCSDIRTQRLPYSRRLENA